MRRSYVALSLLWLGSGCVVGARGRVATNGAQAVPYVQLVAPRPPVAMITTYSPEDMSIGVGRVYIREEAIVTPYGAFLWRVEDEAIGAEAGVNVLFSYFGADVGVQQTFGEGGSTGAFAALGLNVLAACGCL